MSIHSVAGLCYSLRMAINDVAGEWVYHVRDILREFLGHNFYTIFVH